MIVNDGKRDQRYSMVVVVRNSDRRAAKRRLGCKPRERGYCHRSRAAAMLVENVLRIVRHARPFQIARYSSSNDCLECARVDG